MPVANRKVDVFKVLDMQGGDKDKCWLFKGVLNGKGLPYFQYSEHGVGMKRLAYRITYELLHGVSLTSDQLLLHQCDTPACCNPHHTRIGTHKENMQDMRKRQRHGALSHHMVINIRRLADAPRSMSPDELSELYGVAPQTIRDVINRVTYRDVVATEEPKQE